MPRAQQEWTLELAYNVDKRGQHSVGHAGTHMLDLILFTLSPLNGSQGLIALDL